MRSRKSNTGNDVVKLIIDKRDGSGSLAEPTRRRLWKICRRILLILAATPIALMLIYKLPFTHPISTLMLKDTLTLETYKRDWVSLDDIAPVLINSVMMSEDGQFCSHSGVDWRQMKQAFQSGVNGERLRGASTIPMQTVKNLFLWNGRSYVRKLLELPLSHGLTLILSKRRIMEIYLNIVEWGDGIYGIEAAAQHYFNRSASKLTPRQSAYLAVTLPNPILRDAAKPSRNMIRIARIIEQRTKKSGAYVGCVY